MAANTTRRNFRQKRLQEQVLVITGASSGIGLVTARMAVRRGARVVLMARNETALRNLGNELGAQAACVAGDVGNAADVQKAAELAAERFGGFDTWFNNAGVTIYGPLAELSIDDQRRLFDTNFWGVVHGSRAAVEHLRQRGGTLINMGSITSDRAIPLQGIYSASKHAVKGYTDALRMELEHEGAPVVVTLIKPSSIDTPYCRHAKNYMPFEPRNPPPLYAPAVVADAVLRCAEEPHRDIVVGGSGRLMAAAGSNAPRMTDQIMEQTLFDMQMTDRLVTAQNDGNLYAPKEDLEERAGRGERAAARSVYTRATLDAPASETLADFAGSVARMFWRASKLGKRRGDEVRFRR